MCHAKSEPDESLPVDGREFIHRIDARDCIIFANENWFAFARENNAAALDPASVIGRKLEDFISDSTTRHLYSLAIERVRGTRTSLLFPFRCDSPGCRRFMEMQITPQPKNEVEFRNRVLRLEKRDLVRLVEPNADRTSEFLIICGWCKNVRLPDASWVEVEKAVRALNIFDTPRLPGISHGICESCTAVVNESIERQSLGGTLPFT